MSVPCLLLLFFIFLLFIMMFYRVRKWICLYLVFFFFSLIFVGSSWCIIASRSGYVCTLFISSFLYFSFVYHDVLSRQEVDMSVPCLLLLFSIFLHHDVLSRQEVDMCVPCLLLLFSHLFLWKYYFLLSASARLSILWSLFYDLSCAWCVLLFLNSTIIAWYNLNSYYYNMTIYIKNSNAYLKQTFSAYYEYNTLHV